MLMNKTTLFIDGSLAQFFVITFPVGTIIFNEQAVVLGITGRKHSYMNFFLTTFFENQNTN